MSGIKYKNRDVVYISFKKHFCPECSARLKTVKVSKIVNSNSPEAADFDFSSSNQMVFKGDVKFVWKEFECPECKRHYTVNDIRRSEGLQENDYEHPHKPERKGVGFVLFWILGIILLLAYGFLKKFL